MVEGASDRRGLAETATLYVESRATAFQPPLVGCMELVGMDAEKAIEMGEVLLGTRPGRRSHDEITVYKSMGDAVEDLAAAGLVYRAALAKGPGRPSSSEAGRQLCRVFLAAATTRSSDGR